MRLKGNFKGGQLLATMPASVLVFLVNFFNTCNWDGITFKPTQSGRGCRLETVGYTGSFWMLNDEDSESQYLCTVTDGRITEQVEYDGPYWESDNAAFDETYTVAPGGFALKVGEYTPGTGRLRVDDQDGTSLYDSGTISAQITDVRIDIPAGTTSIRVRVDESNPPGYYWDLRCVYEN